MKRAWKVGLIVALVLFICGACFVTAGAALNDWNFQTVREKNPREETYDVSGENISRIRIDINAAEVRVTESEDGDIHITYWESDLVAFDIAEKKGTLTVRERSRPWWMNFGISFGHNENRAFSISIPHAYSGELDLDVALGSVTVEDLETNASFSADLSAGSLKISDCTFASLKANNSLGDVRLYNFSVEKLSCDLSAGEFIAEDLTVEGDIDIDMSLGDLRMEHSFAGGTVRIDSSAGDVDLRYVEVGGSLTIDLSLGNVYALLSGDGYYFSRCETSLGSVKTPSLKGDKVPIRINNSAGDITVEVE